MEPKGKKILIISPSFFGYGYKIYETLCKLGAQSCYITVDKQEDLKKIEKLLSKEDKFDYLLVIKGEFVDSTVMTRISNNSKNIYKILYLYDSVERYPETLKHINLYNQIFSFEKRDCEKHSFIFRPLFYIDEFLDKEEIEVYDICSIASYYPNRFQLFKKIYKQVPHLKIYLKLYISLKSIIRNMLFKLILYPNIITTKSMPFSDLSKIQAQSKAILDIKHPKQEGLTIRTLETMALGKKLITTNPDIKNYDFYNSNNIYILNESNIDGLPIFMKKKNIPVPTEIKSKYSIEYFINEIFLKCN